MPQIDISKYLHGHTSSDMESCINACLECMVACEMCSDACLHEKDVRQLTECIRLDRDCATACATAVQVMSRGGPVAHEVCRMSAEACERCAAECERHADHHEHCRLCAEACRRCATECQRMAGAAA